MEKGKRLCIAVQDEEGKMLLAVYYQRSATTDLMLKEVNGILRAYASIISGQKIKKPKKALIKALYQVGAGLAVDEERGLLSKEQKKILQEFFGSEKSEARWYCDVNNGVIAVTQKRMTEFKRNRDGEVDLVLHEDGEIEVRASDLCCDEISKYYFVDNPKKYIKFRKILRNAFEDFYGVESDISKSDVENQLESIGIGVIGTPLFTSESGDDVLCSNNGRNYSASELRLNTNNSSFDAFLEDLDICHFANPEMVSIVTKVM